MTLRSILHVEDDADIRAIVQLSLETLGGYQLSQYASGPEALEAAPSETPDLILLDVMMPGMSGEDVWKSFTEMPHLRDVPTIFMTAKAEGVYSADLIRRGACAVITKPFDPMSLPDEIRSHWDKCASEHSA
ncbi:Response regulator receiver domain-containing protein [Tranquillimonas rosea]|uniref:Response regulator receiver domain-containing protein n=1 Tax=Tranquillimonas rosea TaxID=641238 RepID=A0A1H9RDV7_9RHOB|nr:response regulator [Tranquillimonas rosea]SER70133.1 Response regulator receiver domain-containing protein [Tranquillimonas rosea]